MQGKIESSNGSVWITVQYTPQEEAALDHYERWDQAIFGATDNVATWRQLKKHFLQATKYISAQQTGAIFMQHLPNYQKSIELMVENFKNATRARPPEVPLRRRGMEFPDDRQYGGDGSFTVTTSQLRDKVYVRVGLTDEEYDAIERGNFWDESVLHFNPTMNQKDEGWRSEHNVSAFTPGTYAWMKPVRNGYALTPRMLCDGVELYGLTIFDASRAAGNFDPNKPYGGELAQRVRYLCDNPPESDEMTEPTIPTIEERHWYQHSLLIAPTQTGKTNVIQWRLAQLLPLVAQGKASIVLMEPKGVLTTDILNMAQTWNMRDRVVILDPADTPVSVNIFDKGDGSSQAITETVGRIARVIGTLSSEFTGFQRDAITFAVRAMFALPEPASMRMLMRILRGGKAALPLESLPETVRDYFELDYREADGRFIVSRLSSLLGNTVFETLFTGKRTTFDMLKEIQAGKLIVVNCASRALGGDSTLYARFWIEEVQRCVYPRLSIPVERRTPTTFIIDEAQDYIAEDRHIAALLAQAAEARIGMMFGMHYLGQLTDAFVRDAVAVNTNLKFAARPATDVPTLARAMNTELEFLTSLPIFTFAYRGPGLQTAIRVKFPQVEFGKMPQMTAEQYAELRRANSRKYAYGEPSPPPQPPEEPAATRENVSMDDLSLADAYAQLAVAIRRGNLTRAAELQEWIRDHTPESPPGRNPGQASKDGW